MIRKKICMVGAFGVGKTSLVRRFVESIFDERYHTTLGVKIDKKIVCINGVDHMLMLWDLAGEDDLTPLKLSNLRGMSGYLLVADGTRPATLAKAIELKERIEGAAGAFPFVLLLNKCDLDAQWTLNPAGIENLDQTGWRILRTSAKTGDGVEEAFHTLATKLL